MIAPALLRGTPTGGDANAAGATPGQGAPGFDDAMAALKQQADGNAAKGRPETSSQAGEKPTNAPGSEQPAGRLPIQGQAGANAQLAAQQNLPKPKSGPTILAPDGPRAAAQPSAKTSVKDAAATPPKTKDTGQATPDLAKPTASAPATQPPTQPVSVPVREALAMAHAGRIEPLAAATGRPQTAATAASIAATAHQPADADDAHAQTKSVTPSQAPKASALTADDLNQITAKTTVGPAPTTPHKAKLSVDMPTVVGSNARVDPDQAAGPSAGEPLPLSTTQSTGVQQPLPERQTTTDGNEPTTTLEAAATAQRSITLPAASVADPLTQDDGAQQNRLYTPQPPLATEQRPAPRPVANVTRLETHFAPVPPSQVGPLTVQQAAQMASFTGPLATTQALNDSASGPDTRRTDDSGRTGRTTSALSSITGTTDGLLSAEQSAAVVAQVRGAVIANLAALPLSADLARADAAERQRAADAMQSQQSQSARGLGPVRVLELSLQPASLGSVTVRLRLSSDGLSVEVSASEAAALEALEGGQDGLKSALLGAGYATSELTITRPSAERPFFASDAPASTAAMTPRLTEGELFL